MRQLACFFLMLLSLLSCKKPELKVEYKLTNEQLAHLMLDLQFSEATLSDFSKAKQDSLKDLYFQQFTKMYNLSEEEIKEEVRLLEEDSDRMKLILDRVKILADSLR